MQRIVAIALVVLVACSGANEPAGSPAASPAPGSETAPPSPSPAAVTGREAPLPRPHQPLPRSAKRLAHELLTTTRLLKRDIEVWLTEGGSLRSRRVRAVALRALWQQRLYRALIGSPGRAERVQELVPARFAREVRSNVRAGAGLRSLVTPVSGPIRFKTYPPDPIRKLVRLYKAAGRRFGIPWRVLAALNFVESKFGRILGPSSAGAQGPMQFIPSTWDIYGAGGDINDPRDSIMAAARYLRASGAPGDMRDALWHYNHSYEYVRAVQIYARQMQIDLRNLYAYYFWQVFVATTKGDVQLTGPGGRNTPATAVGAP